MWGVAIVLDFCFVSFCLFGLVCGFVELRFGVFGLFDFDTFDTVCVWLGMSEFC